MTPPLFSPDALPPGLGLALVAWDDGDPAVLSGPERERAAAFGHPERRRQFVLGRTAARRLAARRLGCAPADVPLAVGPDGAPTLDGLSVSIAHGGHGAGALAAAALADHPVGVDVEAIRARRSDLWTRILTDDERPVLDALGGPSDAAQTLLWSLKEAVLKGQRTGFRAGGRSVRLTLDAEGDVPAAGEAAAVSRRSGAWRLAWARTGDLWVTVAWADQPKQTP